MPWYQTAEVRLDPHVYVLHERLKKFPPAQLLYIIYRRLVEHGFSATNMWVMDKVLRRVNGFSPPQVSEVLPGLFVGGQQSRRGSRRMRELGITAVVNMREESDDAARGVALDHYLWLPITDDAAPDLASLERGSRFIETQRAARRGVYIHCASGVGRAPTMAVAYLVWSGKTLEEAWELMRKARPFIRPTPPQFDILEAFAEKLASGDCLTMDADAKRESVSSQVVAADTQSSQRRLGIKEFIFVLILIVLVWAGQRLFSTP